MAAVQETRLAFGHASKDLRKDKEIRNFVGHFAWTVVRAPCKICDMFVLFMDEFINEQTDGTERKIVTSLMLEKHLQASESWMK